MTVHPGSTRTPSQIISDLLSRHPEAPSLQAEAIHRHALTRSSAANVSETIALAQASRLNYEELRRRLDPRRLRTFNFAAGLLVIVLLSAMLTVLDLIQLWDQFGQIGSILTALAAAAVWLTGAWLTALARRERRQPVVLAAAAAAVLLGWLLVVVHGLDRCSVVLSGMVSGFILVLAAGAAMLIGRMEPAPVLAARCRWHRAQRAHEAAVRLEHDDAEAAAVATGAWLGLVRVSALTEDDSHLADETAALAVALIEGGRVQRLMPGRSPGPGPAPRRVRVP
jgi:hypothetical protein